MITVMMPVTKVLKATVSTKEARQIDLNTESQRAREYFSKFEDWDDEDDDDTAAMRG